MEKLKVLEITGEPILHGGQEVFIFNFIENANLENISVDVLTPYTCENENYKEKIKKTGKIIEFGLPFMPGKSRKLIYDPVFNYLKENHYDVVHIHSGSISVLAYLAKAAKQCNVKKIIVHSHSMGMKSIKHTLVKALYAPLMKKYPMDFVACSYEAGLWKFPKSVADKKLKVITNGIDLDKYKFNEQYRDEIRNKYNINNEIVVGHVGRFSFEKNHKFLIDVFNEFHKENPKTKLMLVGDGELFKEIQSQVKELNLEGDVIFVGNVDDTYKYYSAMDIFCFPSLFEGFGLVILEAQASGLDVLMAEGLPENAKALPFSTTLSINDTNVWVNELNIMMNKKNNRREYLQQLGQYSIENTANNILNLYD